MVELQPIFKKAYWTLAAGGLVYVSFICSLTWPNVQRFALYANKVNPALWEDVNQVERFGFLSTWKHRAIHEVVFVDLARNAGPTIQSGYTR
jgi:hypothetical protein